MRNDIISSFAHWIPKIACEKCTSTLPFSSMISRTRITAQRNPSTPSHQSNGNKPFLSTWGGGGGGGYFKPNKHKFTCVVRLAGPPGHGYYCSVEFGTVEWRVMRKGMMEREEQRTALPRSIPAQPSPPFHNSELSCHPGDFPSCRTYGMESRDVAGSRKSLHVLLTQQQNFR